MRAARPLRVIASRPAVRSPRPYPEFRSDFDRRVLKLFGSKSIHRVLHDQAKTSLDTIWEKTAEELEGQGNGRKTRAAQPLDVHERIVEGLPGEALYISSAMAFDSLQEALPLFSITAKTARQRIGQSLPANEGEIALRIGRALTIAGEALGSLEAARSYLRTPNFALGGAAPRDLLKTAEGEQIVLAEIQAQAEGAPV
jgi:putative toxin-antitoxin system antitoxin component (TIGR02293 family)